MSKSAPKGKPFDTVDKFLTGTPGNDKLRGGEGNDRINGSDGDDQLRGEGGNDFLYGGAGDDRIWGGDGNDFISGSAFADVGGVIGVLIKDTNILWGGRGDDTYFVASSTDQIIEKANEGVDTIEIALSEYTLPDHVENLDASNFFFDQYQLTFTGNSLDNTMTGNGFFFEKLIGLDGNDTLIGRARAGGDYLDGGNGNDVLIQTSGLSIGGAGADLFVSRLEDQTRGIENYLSMPDFNGAEGDRLYLVGNPDVAALFESGSLRFDADNNQLISRQVDLPGYPYSQTFDFGDSAQFDPSWITTVDPLAV